MRACTVAVFLAVVSGCAGTDTGSGSGSTTTTAPGPRCAPTVNEPWRGMAAITEKYRVRIWDKGTVDHTELPMIGNDPNNDATEGDYNVVETVAVDPNTCKPFIGTCCEPVTGITYYDIDKPVEEWGILYGHYPTISPDGTRIAYSSYEDVTVASLDDPGTALVTIKQPGPERATIYDMVWLGNDDLVLLGFTADGAWLWRISVSAKTLSDPVLITDAVSQSNGDLWSVGLVGVDDGRLMVRAPGEGGSRLQRRSLDTLELDSEEPFTGKERTYRIAAGRVVTVLESGRLMAFPMGAEDAPTVGGPEDLYIWAG